MKDLELNEFSSDFLDRLRDDLCDVARVMEHDNQIKRAQKLYEACSIIYNLRKGFIRCFGDCMPYKIQTMMMGNGKISHYRILSPTGRFVESSITAKDAQRRVDHLNQLRKTMWGKK